MKHFTLLLGFFIFQCFGLQAQNNALQFNNDVTQDYVSIPDDVSLHFGTGAFTIEAQVKIPTGNTNPYTIISNRTAGNSSGGYWIYISSTGRLAFTIGTSIVTGIAADLRDNACHHIAITRSSSSILNVYIDGVNVSGYGVADNLTNTHPIWLGTDDFTSPNSHFKGVMDEVRIWNITRTATDIDLYKNATVSATSTGLVAYYQFNQGVAGGNNNGINSLVDATSGNLHQGSLQNFALSGNVSNWVAQCSACITSAGNDTTVCALSNIVLNGTPSGGVWKENGNTISATYTVPLVTGSAPVNHILTYTVSGCTDTVVVKAMPKPNAGNDTTICANTTIPIPIVSSAAILSYWTFDGVNVGNVNTYTSTTPGTHTLIYTSGGCKDTLKVNVLAKPNAGNDTAICVNSTISLASSPVTNNWTDNGVNLGSLTSYTGTTVGTHMLIYTVAGCKDTMMVYVIAKPNAGNDTTVCANTTINIPYNSNAGILSYWTFDGTNVGNVNTYTGTSTGTHTLIYTSGGCKDTVLVTVMSKPNAGNDTTICKNSTINLPSLTSGNWTDNGTSIGNNSLYTGTVVGTHTMIYTVGSCKDTMMIYVIAKPNAGNDTTICANTTITIPINSNAAILSYWTFDGTNVGNVNTYTGTSTGTHTLIYTSGGCKDTVLVTVMSKPNAGNDTTICKNSTINLPSLTSGNWTDNGTSIGNNSLYTGTVVGTHTMIYTVGSCKDTMMIYVIAKPNAGNDTTICANTTINIPINSNAAILSYWTFDGTNVGNVNTYTGTSTGTHTLIYTSGGCKDTVLVTVMSKPNAGNDTTICKNSTINLPSLTSGNWTDNGTSIGNNSLYTGTVVGTHTMIYTVGSCKDTMIITVVAKPNAGNDTTICQFTTINIPSGYWTDNGSSLGNVSTYTGLTVNNHVLIYTLGTCRDTMLIKVQNTPNAGKDTLICSGKKDTLIGFPSNGVWTEGTSIITGNVFSSTQAGNHILIYTLNGCKDTLIVTVTDTCLSTCNYFKLDIQDSNCCRAGIIRNLPGGPNVVAVKYSVSGGVMQGYTTNCSGALPLSSALSGSVSGTVNFSTACANLQLFNTALQSTTSTGSMTVTYTVKYANGDSCSYTILVKGCYRAPHGLCDSTKVQLCACPNSLSNYFNINITNLSTPASPICGIKITKYNSSNLIDNIFFDYGYIAGSPNTPILPPNSLITNFPAVVNYGSNILLQMGYNNSTPFSGYLTITVIHCNGDTCKTTWSPTLIPLLDLKYADYAIRKGVNPYNKLFAYTFKIAGPSKNISGAEPYKIKYITLSLQDTAKGAEIAGLTGAEMYNEKERNKILKFSNTAHARYNALLELVGPLELVSNDSSGVFQVFFANALPKELLFNCYDNSGSILSSGTLALDSAGSVGVMKLGKTNEQSDQLMIFNGYPNPTSGRYNFKMSLPESDNITLHVFDISGKEVYTYNVGTVNTGLVDTNIDMGLLENGTYFINAVSQKQGRTSNSIKIVVIK